MFWRHLSSSCQKDLRLLSLSPEYVFVQALKYNVIEITAYCILYKSKYKKKDKSIGFSIRHANKEKK